MPAEMRGNLPRKSISSKRKTKLHSILLRSGFAGRTTINSEEREFVADSGASMHMVSKKDLNKAELETVRISKSPTMVARANGEVPAKEEATVYVRELDLFVKVMLLENTPAVLSLGKLCEEFGYSYHWTSGRTPHLTNKWQEISLQHIKLRTIRRPWFINEFLHFIFIYFFDIFLAGNCD